MSDKYAEHVNMQFICNHDFTGHFFNPVGNKVHECGKCGKRMIEENPQNEIYFKENLKKSVSSKFPFKLYYKVTPIGTVAESEVNVFFGRFHTEEQAISAREELLRTYNGILPSNFFILKK